MEYIHVMLSLNSLFLMNQMIVLKCLAHINWLLKKYIFYFINQ